MRQADRGGKKDQSKCKMVSAMVVAFCLLAPSIANAQTTEEGRIDNLGEIVVVAQKRFENLQDVPVSITAFDGDAIDEFKFFDNVDLADQVANVDIKNAGIPSSNVFIRGIGNNDFNENNSNAVATYFDGVYIASNVGSNVPIYDLESIEVLRGPQGTLYGKNTTGGAISYFSRKPSGDFTGQGSITYGRFNELRIEGGVSFPMVEDVLSGRVSFYSNTRDGTDVNLIDNSRQNNRNTQAFRAQFLFTPTDNIEALFKASVHKRRSDLPTPQPRGLVNPATGALDLDAFETGSPLQIPGFTNLAGFEDLDPDPFVNSHDGPDKLDLDDLNLTSNIIVDFGSASLTSVTAFIDHKQRLLSDPDGGNSRLLEVRRDNDVKQFSQEFRLDSNGAGPFNWILGAYYFRETIDAHLVYDIFRDLIPAGTSFVIDQNYDQKTTNYSVFAHTTYDLSDKLTVTAGLRFTDEKKDFEQINVQVESDGILDVTPGAILATPIPLTTLSNSWGEVSGKIGIDYQINDDFLVFASGSRGFKSGGFTGGALLDISELSPGFDPEILTAYEVGAKTSWLDNKLRVNVTGFYYNYSDLQVFVFRPGATPGAFVQTFLNAADATIYGAEVEVAARPVKNLSINFGVGLLNSEYKNFVNGAGVDFSGNRLINAPSLDLNAAATYWVPLSGGNELKFRGDVNHVSKRFFDPSNSNRLSSGGGHTEANFAVSLFLNEGAIELQGWVKNIFDEVDPVDMVDLSTTGADIMWFNDPRTAGITVGFKF